MKNYFIMHSLFWQVVAFFVVVNAEYLSSYKNKTHENLLKPERFKRSPYKSLPKILVALIKTENGKYIFLKWIQTKQYLANENLPVWTATEYRDKLDTNQKNKLNIMEDVGDFIMYQDVEQSSAVVYFEKRKTLHGVIGTNYVIDDLPIEFLNTCHNVGGRYVTKRIIGYHSNYNYPDIPSDIIKYFIHPNLCPNYAINLNPSTSKHYSMKKFLENTKGLHLKESEMNIGASCLSKDNSENYYLESLVFVTYDISKPFKATFDDEYLLEIVSDNIIYFNAADMVLAKLKKYGLNIHINLAGIIIEDEKDIFSSLLNNPVLKYSDSTSSIEIDEIYIGFENHFENHHTPFAPDSFDVIFLMTSHLIQYEGVSSGVTFEVDNIYEERQENKPYRAIPLTVLHYKTDYADYFTAAHEIGHVLNVQHDSKDSGSVLNGVQCCGIMQWKNSYCLECINWSAESVHQLKEFIRENRNRCFLLNYPRSLYPDEPKKLLSPCLQCHCYGFGFYGSIYNECSLEIPDLGCISPLPCMNTSYSPPIQEDTILPLDGTPCGKNKVCWRGECVRV